MYSAYLTIDDSPSQHTCGMVDYLVKMEIPAILYCRGDLIEKNPSAITHAINNGMIIANHLYGHRRSSCLSFDEICEEILKTEQLIDAHYRAAGVVRPIKAVRFPYLDRGMGGWFIRPESIRDDYAENRVIDLLQYGLGHDPEMHPKSDTIKLKDRLQQFLEKEGFEVPDFSEVTACWYRGNAEINRARDSLITCSSSDWMLTQRHLGNWPWNDVESLVARMMEHFCKEGGQIVLLHDQDELWPVFQKFIEQLIEAGVKFLPIIE